MNIEELEELKAIVAGKPEGATHKDRSGHYYKLIITDECIAWCVWGVNSLAENNQWHSVDCPDFDYIRSLSDIETIISLSDENAELDRRVDFAECLMQQSGDLIIEYNELLAKGESK